MKNLFICIAIIITSVLNIEAVIPNELNYQVMALDPTTGKVLSNQKVSIEMALLKGINGEKIWSQTFDTETDEAGICAITLDVTEVDWNTPDLYMSTIINENDCGSAKLCSVPYSIQAKTIDGVITRRDLIGTWASEENEGFFKINFNNDGTASCIYKMVAQQISITQYNGLLTI